MGKVPLLPCALIGIFGNFEISTVRNDAWRHCCIDCGITQYNNVTFSWCLDLISSLAGVSWLF